jgi:hypothetical protein
MQYTNPRLHNGTIIPKAVLYGSDEERASGMMKPFHKKLDHG